MKFYMGPEQWPETIADIEAQGHSLVPNLEEAQCYVNTAPDPADVPELPESIEWVQHCFTGVEKLVRAGLIREVGIPWCNAAGAFAKPVAESALGLMLSAAHHHKAFALAGTWRVAEELDRTQAWLSSPRTPTEVVILGAGGIAAELIRLLEPFGVRVTAVNRSGRPVEGAAETLRMSDAESVWERAGFLVSILPLTTETRGIIGADRFKAMKSTAIFINVGRGATVVTDDLVTALSTGEIAGAGLEVVDPEPLPDGHPLYSAPNCTMTPHMAASAHVAMAYIGKIFNANAAAYLHNEPMPTRVDPSKGY